MNLLPIYFACLDVLASDMTMQPDPGLHPVLTVLIILATILIVIIVTVIAYVIRDKD